MLKPYRYKLIEQGFAILIHVFNKVLNLKKNILKFDLMT